MRFRVNVSRAPRHQDQLRKVAAKNVLNVPARLEPRDGAYMVKVDDATIGIIPSKDLDPRMLGDGAGAPFVRVEHSRFTAGELYAVLYVEVRDEPAT